MRRTVELRINGQRVAAEEGMTVASAMLAGGVPRFRRSVRGEARAPLCGMGICHECRVTVDGVSQRRACMIEVAAGMVVASDD
jgi:D-hydroxyproline dehydrogenase subunit gamma